jgi:hypothetical protein
MIKNNNLSMLIGQSEYSTKRAKWFYHSTELIINWVLIITLAISAVWIIYLTLFNIALGVVSLIAEIIPLIALIVGVIFFKLTLLGIGALIRIAEVLEITNGMEQVAPEAAEPLSINPSPSSPANSPRTQSSTPQPVDDNEAKKYGINFDGEKYVYKSYKYDKLSDAINYAKKDLGQ